MKTKKQTPTAQRETAEVKFIINYKGTKISLSRLQYLMFIRLSNGNKHTSHKLILHLHATDPRKGIQYLRRKGINVQDVWVKATKKIPRHKRYWIDPKECE